MIAVITSFDQTYYDKIGRDCVDSFLRHWSLPITIYNEGSSIQPTDRITVIDFATLDPAYQELQDNPTMSDRVKRFGKKAWSFIHAMHHVECDWLVWLDADVITQRSDPVQLLNNVLAPRYLAMYLGVRYDNHRGVKFGNWLVPETGFFAVNRRHSQFVRFRDRYQQRYHDLEFQDLRRSYDNDVFGAVVSEIPADYLDLCADLPKGYKTPLRHTVFGEYLHHYKAKHSKANYAAVQ